jgi:hypothetical protein
MENQLSKLEREEQFEITPVDGPERGQLTHALDTLVRLNVTELSARRRVCGPSEHTTALPPSLLVFVM